MKKPASHVFDFRKSDELVEMRLESYEVKCFWRFLAEFKL